MDSPRSFGRSRLTLDGYRRWTTFALWSLTVIVVSGGAVRLTASGLGCSDWPNCQQDQLVADLEYHSLIEFVNRMFTGVVTVAVAMAVLGSLRLAVRRRDLVWLSWGLVGGVIAQIVLGGLLVKTDLDPRFAMGHFLLSMVLLWNAVVLQHRAGVSQSPTRIADGPSPDGPSKRLANLSNVVFVFGAALLVTGTVVTGSGPHSGSTKPEVASRLPFLVKDVTRVHSSSAILVLGLVVALGYTAHRLGNEQAERDAERVGILLVVQGLIGYLQYFTGVPVLLVGIHIALASLTWISIVRMRTFIIYSDAESPTDVTSPDLVGVAQS